MLHLAYHVVLDGRHKVVVDDQEGPDFDTIGEIFISPNGAHVAYGAKRVDQEMVMIDGKEYPGAGNLVMSPAGNYFAHARENLKFPRTSSLWINGTEGPEFEGFLYGCPWVFTSDNTLEFMVGKGTEIIHVEATIQP